jgi:hypothetical protein
MFGNDDAPSEAQAREFVSRYELVRVRTRDPQSTRGLLDRPNEFTARNPNPSST